MSHEHPDGCRRGIKYGDSIFFDNIPPPFNRRIIESPFVNDCSCPVCQWSVYYLAMPGKPANISSAPVDRFFSQIEDPLISRTIVYQIATCTVDNSFGLTRSP